MKKLVVLLLIIVFILGISMSSNSINSKLFDEKLDEFEEQISIPNNEYIPSDLIPKKSIINKVAEKIEDLISILQKK